jgi:hypothetical protein
MMEHPRLTQPVSRRQIRDSWSALARRRKTAGDAEGARRASRAARMVSGDDRIRHDQGGNKRRR